MIFKFFNLLFRIFIIFLICFVWIRYFVKNLSMALVYTSLLTISIEILIHFLLQRKNKKNELKKEEEKLAEKISSNFIYDSKKAIKYFSSLCKINYSVKTYSKFLVLSGKEEKSNLTILYPLYSYNNLSAQDLVNILQKTEKFSPNKIVVCTYKIGADAKSFVSKIKDTKIVLLDSRDCFLKLIKPHNFYPEDLKEIDFSSKPKFKEFLLASISHQRAKGYLLASLVLLFSSFIVKMNIYYVVVSSLLLILALISLLYKPKNINYNENVL